MRILKRNAVPHLIQIHRVFAGRFDEGHVMAGSQR